jgi:hypothetical protein
LNKKSLGEKQTKTLSIENMAWMKIVEHELPRYPLSIRNVLNYCEPHTEQMWAAYIIGLILDCDFRDSKQELQKFWLKAEDRVKSFPPSIRSAIIADPEGRN